MIAQTQFMSFTRSFTNRPRKGTRMIYMVVMKPDFPTVVWMMPYCWMMLAAQRITPQITPQTNWCRFAVIPDGRTEIPFLSRRKMTGTSTRPARKYLAACMVKGPT